MINVSPSPYQVGSSNWVWRSSTQSIVRQQASVLGFAEVIVSMIAFWWFASVTSWPVLTLIAFLAVPLLLLRSPQSIHSGKEQVRIYWNKSEADFEPKKFVIRTLIVVLPISVLILVSFRSVYPEGGDMLATALRLSFAFFGGAIVGLLMVGVMTGLGVFTAPGAGLFDDFDQFDDINGLKSLMWLWLLFGIAMGFWLFATLIRLRATIRHLPVGLTCFVQNVRESTLVVDSFQLPQLMPDATSVHPLLSVSGIRQAKVFKSGWPKFLSEFWKFVLMVVMIIPAWLYRLNIKANAFFWGALAFTLSPRQWGKDVDDRGKLSNLVSALTQSLLFLCVPFLLAILGQKWLPTHYLELLKKATGDWLSSLIDAFIDIPIGSARYIALAVLCMAVVWLLCKSYSFGNANSGVLTNPADWVMLDKEGHADFVRQAGLKVLRAYKFAMVATISTVWVFALWAVSNTTWGQNRFPHAIWSWLRSYL